MTYGAENRALKSDLHVVNSYYDCFVFSAWSSMRSGIQFVIIDRENLKYADMLPYISEVSF